MAIRDGSAKPSQCCCSRTLVGINARVVIELLSDLAASVAIQHICLSQSPIALNCSSSVPDSPSSALPASHLTAPAEQVYLASHQALHLAYAVPGLRQVDELLPARLLRATQILVIDWGNPNRRAQSYILSGKLWPPRSLRPIASVTHGCFGQCGLTRQPMQARRRRAREEAPLQPTHALCRRLRPPAGG